MAQYTRKVLSEILKSKLSKKPLDSITVKELVESCGMNRKTFYYNYNSKGEFVESVLASEICARIGENITPETWKSGFNSALLYIQENHKIIKNIYNSSYWPEIRIHMEKGLSEAVTVFTKDAIRIYRETSNPDLNISDADFDFIVYFYTALFFRLVEDWFKNGMLEKPEDFQERISKLTKDVMYHAFERFFNE